jgi:hypothetical protein
MNLRQGGLDRPKLMRVEEFVRQNVLDKAGMRLDDPATIRRICDWLIPSVRE